MPPQAQGMGKAFPGVCVQMLTEYPDVTAWDSPLQGLPRPANPPPGLCAHDGIPGGYAVGATLSE